MAKLSLLEKFNKIKNADEREKKGLSRSLSRARKQVASIKKQEEKDRAEAIKDTIDNLEDILGSKTDIGRINSNALVLERGIEELQVIIERNTSAEKDILDMKSFRLDVEDVVANLEADNLADAQNGQISFNEAVNQYVIDTLNNQAALDEDKIKDMWDKYVGKKSSDVLMRGTTVFFSIDLHFQQVIALVRKGECSDWKIEIMQRLTGLFDRYNIDVDLE